jgi:hypothetical protein
MNIEEQAAEYHKAHLKALEGFYLGEPSKPSKPYKMVGIASYCLTPKGIETLCKPGPLGIIEIEAVK